MKKILKFLLLSQSVLLLSACVDNNEKSQQRLYFIDETYDFTQSLIKVELDKENERFIFNYTDKDENSGYYYYVSFRCNDYYVKNYSTNSSEFKYLYENNEPIVFDENGWLIIYESTKLYTDYSSANLKVKEAINNDDFHICFGSGTFIPQRHDEIILDNSAQ